MELDYRSYLRSNFERRRKVNPGYSLRAFSRDIGLSPSGLSRVLNGKIGLSHESAVRISERLKFDRKESDRFVKMVSAVSGRSRQERAQAESELRTTVPDDARLLPEDMFRLISDWYHYAIFVFLGLRGAKGTVEELHERFGISIDEANQALERLRQAGLIEQRRGRWVRAIDRVQTPDGVPSSAVRASHQQILAKATAALAEHPVEERDFTAMTIPLSASELPRFRQKIREFREEFEAMADSAPASADRSDVYCLGVQLFRLSTPKRPSAIRE